MQLKICFLGTASAFPTKERAHSAIYFDVGKEAFLFDAGENVQRQITLANLSPMKISKIFISHWHGDHVLGLAGLLQSYGINKRKEKIEIYGPKETKRRIENLRKAFDLRLNYPIVVYEINSKKILETEEYEIWAKNTEHGKIPCLAFAFLEKPKRRIKKDYIKKFGLESNPIIKNLQEGKDIVWKGKKIKASLATYIQPGKKIVFILDSSYTKDLEYFAKDADLLICESTFGCELKDEAYKYGHMCAADAAILAKKAGAKKLILTHFSQRYKDVTNLLKEAKKIFQNTIAAKDFLIINL